MAQLLKVIDELEAKAKAATPDQVDSIIKGALNGSGRQIWHMRGAPAFEEQAKRDVEYYAACSPDTVLTLITALREAHEVIEFYASQKHLEKLMPGVNYDMQRADWRVSHPYVGGVEYGQTAAAFLEKWSAPLDCE